MNFFPVLAWMSPLFAYSQPALMGDAPIYQGKNMQVEVSEQPLAQGAVKIVPKLNARGMSSFRANERRAETYDLLQKTVSLWKKNGTGDYMIYSKETGDPATRFQWEIVPYTKEGFRFVKQFKVLWNITFGAPSISPSEKVKTVATLDKIAEATDPVIQKIAQGHDAFCNSKIIEKQCVFEGKQINILYNYAPIGLGEDKLHFLLVPKKHKETFSDLTKSEYLESQDLGEKLAEHYKAKGITTVYRFDKNGVEAGQTVPHWHQHVIFTATKAQDLFGKLNVLKNIVLGSSAMSDKALSQRVAQLKSELASL